MFSYKLVLLMAESEKKYRRSIEANGKLFDKEISPEVLSYISSHKEEIETNIRNFKEGDEDEDVAKALFASRLMSRMGFTVEEKLEIWRDTGRNITIMMGVISKAVEPYMEDDLTREQKIDRVFAKEEKDMGVDPRDSMNMAEIELNDYLGMEKGQMRNGLVAGFLANRGGEVSPELRRRAITSLSNEKEEVERGVNGQMESNDKVNIENKPSKVTDDEFNLLFKECMNTIFFSTDKDLNVNKIIRSLSSEGGLWSSLKGGNIPLDFETRKRLEESGLEAWLGLRKTMDGWQSFKNADELTSKDIRNNAIFLSEEVLVKLNDMNNSPILGEKSNYSSVEYRNVGKEVSGAMKKLYDYFDGNGDPKKAVDHWGVIDYSLAQKAEIYDSLGINRYVGEAAFVALLSGLMLTGTKGSKLDTFRALLNTSSKRVGDYKVSPERDPFARMLVQEKTIKGKKPEINKAYVVELENDIKKILPNKLIPTGLSGGGKEALDRGDWLGWSVTNIKDQKPRSTDLLKQRALASNAMDIVDLTKAAMKGEATIDDLAKLKGKLYASFSAYKENGWVDKDGNIIEDFRVGDGDKKQDMANWVSKIMLSSSKTFLYTHSLLDYTNQKPLNMYELRNVASRIYSKDRSKGNNFIGLGSNAGKERREMKKFFRFTSGNVFKIVYGFLGSLPRWYMGSYLSNDQIKASSLSKGSRREWFLLGL